MDMLAPTEAHVLPFPSSSYVELFAQIAALQAKGDHYGLIQAAECADLAVCLPSYYPVYCDSLTFPPLGSRRRTILILHDFSLPFPSCFLV